jgi:transcriptional/translational regulatory protein YebC/TACO1
VSPPEELAVVRRLLEDAGYAIEDAQPTMLPKTTVQIEDEGVARKIVRLLDGLEENDDVQGVYANFDISEQLLEAAV